VDPRCGWQAVVGNHRNLVLVPAYNPSKFVDIDLFVIEFAALSWLLLPLPRLTEMMLFDQALADVAAVLPDYLRTLL
jgi:hypothetical protein